jgi:hypothetical protein
MLAAYVSISLGCWASFLSTQSTISILSHSRHLAESHYLTLQSIPALKREHAIAIGVIQQWQLSGRQYDRMTHCNVQLQVQSGHLMKFKLVVLLNLLVAEYAACGHHPQGHKLV